MAKLSPTTQVLMQQLWQEVSEPVDTARQQEEARTDRQRAALEEQARRVSTYAAFQTAGPDVQDQVFSQAIRGGAAYELVDRAEYSADSAASRRFQRLAERALGRERILQLKGDAAQAAARDASSIGNPGVKLGRPKLVGLDELRTSTETWAWQATFLVKWTDRYNSARDVFLYVRIDRDGRELSRELTTGR